MNLHSNRVLTDAIIATLTGVGLSVGDAIAPDTRTNGYVVVYSLGGGVTDGPISNPNDDAQALYQLTSVSLDRRQCEWIADKARATLLGASLSIGGLRRVIYIEVDMLGGVMRDDDVQPPAYYSPDRYRIWTTPA